MRQRVDQWTKCFLRAGAIFRQWGEHMWELTRAFRRVPCLRGKTPSDVRQTNVAVDRDHKQQQEDRDPGAKTKMAMNFEGFQDLMRRIARNWYERAKAEVKVQYFWCGKIRFITNFILFQIIEMNMVNNYLKESPFVAKQTPENELAYEKLSTESLH